MSASRRRRGPTSIHNISRSIVTSNTPPRSLEGRGKAANSSLATEASTSNAPPPHIPISNEARAMTSGRHLGQRGAQPTSFHSFCGSLITILDTNTPLRQYHNLVETGALRGDEHQTRIIQGLQKLHDQLEDYVPPPIPEASTSNSLVSLHVSNSHI